LDLNLDDEILKGSTTSAGEDSSNENSQMPSWLPPQSYPEASMGPDSFDLQQVMERAKDRFERLELMEEEGIKTGEDVYRFLRRGRLPFGGDDDDEDVLAVSERPASDRSLNTSVRWAAKARW